MQSYHDSTIRASAATIVSNVCVRGPARRGTFSWAPIPDDDTGDARAPQAASVARHPREETAMSTRDLHLVPMDVNVEPQREGLVGERI